MCGSSDTWADLCWLLKGLRRFTIIVNNEWDKCTQTLISLLFFILIIHLRVVLFTGFFNIYCSGSTPVRPILCKLFIKIFRQLLRQNFPEWSKMTRHIEMEKFLFLISQNLMKWMLLILFYIMDKDRNLSWKNVLVFPACCPFFWPYFMYIYLYSSFFEIKTVTYMTDFHGYLGVSHISMNAVILCIFLHGATSWNQVN